ncbi:MAG: hypothetical protein A2144_00140 [Chloroflexi bacterium RBG_16_50_9]|nr:MAG: hypothetical protein A2144_00140 [Chloroflexi bacterium RBG_16_50_9]
MSRALGYVATGLLLPMMLLTAVDVFLRFAFNRPIIGTPEITKLIMVCLPLSLAWCALQKRHVVVDVLMSRFPQRVQAIVNIITLIIGLGAIGFMTWRAFVLSLFVLKFRYIASILMPVPEFPFYWIFILGSTMLFLALLSLLIQEVKGVTKR